MPNLRAAGEGIAWRVGTGHWRWLLLGSLGLGAGACWGEVDAEPGDPSGGSEPVSSTSSGGSSGHTTSAETVHCSNPEALGGGWELCANGLRHRAVVAGECASALPRAERIAVDVLQRLYPGYLEGNGGGGGSGGGGNDIPVSAYTAPNCVRDSDCTRQPFGHCEVASLGEGSTGVLCEYGCVTDSDCDPHLVCVCGSPIGQCRPSSCISDADCNGEGMCSNFDADPGCPHVEYACQTRADQCATNADCPPDRQTCTVERSADQRVRRCSAPTVACGRPFLVAGAARRAEPCERADWYASLPASTPSGLLLSDPELCAQLAQGWLDQALLEHASVAAFARFSLQLLSLGAPAELVVECGRALQDEIGHAQACFSLARRHTERAVGPGPLPIGGALDEPDLLAIVLGTIAEGCIGETLAALEAAEARAHCKDAAACAVLERISADETRHAQLAWRFLSWALETGPESLRAPVRECFARELGAVQDLAPPLSGLDERLLSQGLMGAGQRAALRRRVLREVIAPCAEALLGSLEAALEPRLAGPGLLTGAVPLC